MLEPHLTAYVSALLTPLVAAFATYIAASQYITARNKLRFDLFEKRFAVYKGARDFLNETIAAGEVTNESLRNYRQSTDAAKWVVAHEVHDYLECELYKKALDAQRIQSELEGVDVGEERAKLVDKKAALRLHFLNQYDRLDALFSPYLQLKD